MAKIILKRAESENEQTRNVPVSRFKSAEVAKIIPKRVSESAVEQAHSAATVPQLKEKRADVTKIISEKRVSESVVGQTQNDPP